MADTFTPEQIAQILEEFFKIVGTRQYVGARYVPLFGRKDEDSIEWDNTAPYEPLTIVLYQGNSYTSRQYVPVGVEITNQAFWALTGNYNAQVEQYRRETQAAAEAAAAAQNDIDTLLPKSDFDSSHTVASAITAVYTEVKSRVIPFSNVQEMQASDKLYVGAVCETLYHTNQDNHGGMSYLISDTPSQYNFLNVPCGSLYAIAQIGNVVDLNAFGATKNSDIATILSSAIAYLMERYPVTSVAGDRKMGGGVILFSEGEYRIESTIDMQNVACVDFIGCSRGSTILNITAESGFSNWKTGDIPAQWQIKFENLTFTNGTAVIFVSCHDIFITNCRFFNMTNKAAVRLYLTAGVYIDHCSFYGVGTGIELRTIGNGPSTTLSITQCWFAHCGTGFLQDFSSSNYATNILIEDCIFEYCSTRGIYAYGMNDATKITELNVIDCYFEGNSQSSTFSNISLIAERNFVDPTEPALNIIGVEGVCKIVAKEARDYNFAPTKLYYYLQVLSTGSVIDTITKHQSTFGTNIRHDVHTTWYATLSVFNSAGVWFGTIEKAAAGTPTLTKIAGNLTLAANTAIIAVSGDVPSRFVIDWN